MSVKLPVRTRFLASSGARARTVIADILRNARNKTVAPKLPLFLLPALASAWLTHPLIAYADEVDATHRLFAYWHQGNIHMNGIEESSTTAKPTLVHGIYALYSRGQWVAEINDSANLWVGGGQASIFANGRYRAMSGDEKAALRSEIARNVAWDQLIKLTYGDGGGRRLIELSAIDCPVCRKFETTTHEYAKSLNTTFYVVPSSLYQISQGAAPVWRNVALIWCAKDRALAWKAYWATHSVPAEQKCGWNAQSAQEATNVLAALLKAAGIPGTNTTPTFILENGERLQQSEVSAAFADRKAMARVFGPDGLHASPPESESRWLSVASTEVGRGQ
jgi:hypothetical protein